MSAFCERSAKSPGPRCMTLVVKLRCERRPACRNIGRMADPTSVAISPKLEIAALLDTYTMIFFNLLDKFSKVK